MPRKKANIHYLYKTTCIITDRYYIGMHSTTNIDDGYMGSGTRLKYSIRKYGKENHTKDIMEFFDSRELLIEGEKKAITPDMLVDKMCMNLKEGGSGGFANQKHQEKTSKAGKLAFLEKLKNDEVFRANHSKKMSDIKKKACLNSEIIKNLNYDWTGKKHSGETKKLMSEKKKGLGLGETNSQYSTFWITDGVENKKIKCISEIPDGWKKGRVIRYSNQKTKLTTEDVIKIKELLKVNIKQNKIANMFDVAQETISKINRGLIWK